MPKYTLNTTPLPFEKLAIDYQHELNAEQLAVVTGGDGPCLVLAGAGSGKTRTLVYRVAYLLEQGVDPQRILLVTFTNKAAREMMARLDHVLKGRAAGLWGGTFHHVGHRLLRMYGQQLDIPAGFTIMDSEDAKTLVKSCVADVGAPKDKYFPKSDLIHKMISLSVNLNQSLEDIVADRYEYLQGTDVEKIKRIAALYVEKKRAANALDYDDLLLHWYRILVERPELRARLSMKFSHLLVDEFQDTNYLQANIVYQMASSHRNVLVVGDDSQSIYSFRGADVNNILSFPRQFADAKTFKLEHNYRSTPEILALANVSIEYNTRQFDKQLRTTKSSGDKPWLVPLQDNHQQAQFVCQRILELRDEHDWALNDIAVLVRAHYQTLELELEMNKRGIPYEMRGGLRFFEQAHIKDVIAHLKILASPTDELSWRRVLGLQRGIGAAAIQKLWPQIAAAGSLELALEHNVSSAVSRGAASGWQALRSLLAALAAIDQSAVAELIQTILARGYTAHVIASFDNANDRNDDLQQLGDFAGQYDSLEKFLADVALSEGFKGETITGYQDGPGGSVTVSTIHQAKGLEWKAVFIIGLAEGQFPHSRVYDRPSELEEERRLFYVAVTRAEEQLYITYPILSSRGGFINQLSQFVKELPDELFERLDIEQRAVLPPLPETARRGGLAANEARYETEDGDGWWQEPF